MLIKTNTAKIRDKKPIIKRDFANFDSEMFLETISHKFQHLPQTEGDPSKDLNQALKVLVIASTNRLYWKTSLDQKRTSLKNHG